MIDARGLSCPLPVVLTQKEIKAHHPQRLEVLVSAACSRENVTRLAHACGYEVEVTAEGEDIRLLLTRQKEEQTQK